MTKIRPVLLWLLLNPFSGFGQTTHSSTVKYAADQPVFTAHRLTAQVVPVKEQPFVPLSKHPVSLPCLTLRQQPQRPC